MKKCVIIYNPESGYKKNKLNIEVCQDILSKNDYDVSFVKTEKKGDAQEYIYNMKEADLVIVAGGDGTLNEAISGNIKREKPLLLSHLPVGTITDVGKLYGFTKSTSKDLKLMMDGEIRNIDVGLINNIPFVYVACFGNYTNISYETPRKLKKMFGRLGYFLFALRHVGQKIRSYHLKYEIDNNFYEGDFSFIFITNSSRVAGLNNIYDDVKLDDNMFEIALCNVKTRRELIKTFYYLRTKDINTIPNIQYYQTNNLKIHFSEIPEFSWCIDGEEMNHHDCDFSFNINKKVHMLLPKKNLSRLFKDEDK